MKRVCLTVLFSMCCFFAHPQFYYEDTGKNSTGVFTPKGVAQYTSGNTDPAGDGWLRFTGEGFYVSGYVMTDAAYESSLGLVVEFDFKVWGRGDWMWVVDPGTWPLADGFSVFLYDGSVEEQDFVIGGLGGGLGYLPGWESPDGVSGSYLGVGIDEYGNFLCNILEIPQVLHHAISAVSGKQSEYSLIATSGMDFSDVPSLAGTELSIKATTRPTDSEFYRRIRVQMDPDGSGGMFVSAFLKVDKDGDFITVFTDQHLTDPVYPTLKVGFAASTGDFTANHEVRNVTIRNSGVLSVFKVLPDTCITFEEPFYVNTIIGGDNKVVVNDIVIIDTFPANFNIDTTTPYTITGGTFGQLPTLTTLGDGSKVYTYSINLPLLGTATVSWLGKVTSGSSKEIVSKAAVIPPDDISDNSILDNYSTLIYSLKSVNNHYNIVAALPGTEVTLATLTDGTASGYTWYQKNASNVWVGISGEVDSIYKHTISSTLTDAVLYFKCVAGFGDCSDEAEFEVKILHLKDDYVYIFKDSIVDIDVRANDMASCAGQTQIHTNAQNGNATLNGNNIVYTPDTGFLGRDSITYKVDCSGEKFAKVYITVHELPDNISDADCVVDPLGTAFTFNLLASSPGGHGVSNVAVPLVGDIDNDGFTEIVVGDNGFINTKILQIYKLRNNEIVHQQSIHTPAFTNNAVPYAIAKVDDNDYAAIFLCTTYSNNSVDDDRLKLIKYVYNPVTKLYEEFRVGGNTKRGAYSAFSRKEMAQPMIVDFNGDGIPEVVVYDKVYNARTMELLVDGGLLQYAVVADSSAMGFGAGGHGNNNQTIESSSLMAIGDMDNDGIPEVIGGNCVYKVNIVNPNGLSGNSFTLWSRCNKIGPAGEQHDEAVDGTTAIADMDGDGFLDVIVTVARDKSPTGQGCLYIWNPRTGNVMHTDIITDFPITNPGWGGMGISVAFIGDLDNDGQPEVCLTASYRMYAFDFDPVGKRLTQRWQRNTGDDSGATTMSMFDFDQDGSVELVYRDQNNLRILNGSDGTDKISVIACSSFTGNEYPVVADVNGDGAADIIVTCGTSVNVYSSNPVGTWAPARRVWNQFSYNVVNVNEDLTIPKYQLHPATVFPGANGILGDGDDIRPYNNYLQQQTVLSPDGIPFWPAPDAEVDSLSSSLTASGNRLTIKACFKNTGDASIGTPIYATMYSDSIGGTIIYVDSVNVQLDVSDNTCITFTIPDASTLSGMYNIVIRINDKNGVFPYQPECDEENNVLTFINPLHMTKDAEVLTVFAGNGSYANPVSLLGSETIKYTITAVNPTQNPVTIVVTDTLPAYLGYETGSAAIPGSGFESISPTTGITPQRTILKWKYTLANFKDTKSVTFEAKPVSGAVASQPLFINHATVSLIRVANDTIQHIRTNGTFHQGAGISIMTFSAGLGGEIFNATEQALDYMSTPEAGIIIASEEGYKFAGWSHNGYTSLRGVAIAAQKGIMHYDTLTVYGNVELHADFVPKEESLGEEIEEVEPKTSEATDKVWTVNDELFITTTQAGSIVRIYTTEGVLREQRTIVSAGTTAIKISRGIYIVTINNNIGNKIMIKL